MLSAAIDIGNTRIKWALFEGQVLEVDGVVDSIDQLPRVWDGRIIPTGIYAASGALSAVDLPSGIQWMNVVEAKHLPFQLDYGSPKTLGSDRLALAAAAVEAFPGEHVLVVSMGTCITYNLIQNNGIFLGGHISPGWGMRLRAMHEFTHGLPLVAQEINADVPAKTTSANMQSGAFLGVVGELQFMMETYIRQYPGLNIVLTGGDAESFHQKLNFTIFARPGFLLTGLNSIHQLNPHP